MKRILATLAVMLLIGSASAFAADAAPGAQPTPQQRAAMLQQWLKASQAQLRGYQWIETTAVSMDGDEKSRKQNTCYYGADGQLQKVPAAGATEEKPSGGPLKRKIAANKKEELTSYMQSAVALVRSYVPPDPALIQKAVGAGAFSVNMVQPGRLVQLVFKNYLKAGDSMSVDVELPTNRLTGIHVSTYLADAKDAMQLDVAMGVLPDGTIYSEKTTLDAIAKKMIVTIENSGYRRVGG